MPNAGNIAQRLLVFVYGTLKRGEPNAYIMTNPATGSQKFIGCGRTVNAYPMVIASRYNIPFCLEKPGIGRQVTGEVYEVDEQKLKALDELEEHPTFYKRQLQQIEMDHNETVTAWIYLLPKWKANSLEDCTDYLETYNSNGPHNRPYVERSVPVNS
ncbi:unnamed protein product [Gongylonema pulchrum]|uniref:Gamma-glutamylcyclotransferase family protein n=1 Tax=Gongylonema pulchrum TaxID=637853 RepID=A0A183E7B3_9BILA|nr:unnamed protein product [Gongylonema pulchrum]